MSDVEFTQAVAGAPESAPPPGNVTAGTMMRNAREAAGLHVAALAVSMKIPVKKLEALEADRLDLLHDAVFVRALAASVCRALKIDSTLILSKLPLNTAPRLNVDERGINAPFHSTSDASGTGLRELLFKPSSLFVLALLVAGIAVYFLPDTRVSDVTGELAHQASRLSESPAAQQIAQPPVQMFESVPVPLMTVSAPIAVGASATSSAVAVAAFGSEAPVVKAFTQPIPSVVASQSVSTASRPFSAPVLSSTGIVVFKAKGSTWVKVVDAKGAVQLSKTLADGEVVGASGVMPLSVVIGRVDSIEVEVRGQAFSLSGLSKDNVARFEVK